jgi:hypothetical protein
MDILLLPDAPGIRGKFDLRDHLQDNPPVPLRVIT